MEKTYGRKDEGKARLAVWVPLELVEQVRGAISNVAPVETGGGMSAFVQQALERELERLSKKHYKGRKFPRIEAGSLRTGPRGKR